MPDSIEQDHSERVPAADAVWGYAAPMEPKA